MMTLIPGWTVARAIPTDVWAGLVTGQYTLHGGVIRYAACTARAGQIVRHLIPAVADPFCAIPNLVNTYQLYQLSGQVNSLTQVTQHVLHIASATAAVSGLNLAVATIGFALLHAKLNQIDGRLQKIEHTVKEIQAFLQLSENASLKVAIKNLLTVDKITDVADRKSLLQHSKITLAEINEKYRELLANAQTIEAASTYEEYFSLTALAQTRCAAELGWGEVAAQEFQEMTIFWKDQARRVINTLLLKEFPERFLCSDFATDISISTFVEWLDFAHNQTRGYAWIDEMRQRIQPWYTSSLVDVAAEAVKNPLSHHNIRRHIRHAQNFAADAVKNPLSLFNANASRYGKGDVREDRDTIIPLMRKLIARNNVYEGHCAQYELLRDQNMLPSEFERRVHELPENARIQGYIILEPLKSPSAQKVA